jgi:hypothetical protein
MRVQILLDTKQHHLVTSSSQRVWKGLDPLDLANSHAKHFKYSRLSVFLTECVTRREPGTGPVTGERVQYVVVREAPHLADIKSRTIGGVSYAAKDWPPRHERCEDPAFVKAEVNFA